MSIHSLSNLFVLFYLPMRESLLYQQIVDKIKEDILNGTYQPGDRLPPIQSFQKSCCSTTVQRAYKELANQGLVTRQAGRGTFVADRPKLDLNKNETMLRQAKLANTADAFLIKTLLSGYNVEEVRKSIHLAIDRWQVLQKTDPAAHIGK